MDDLLEKHFDRSTSVAQCVVTTRFDPIMTTQMCLSSFRPELTTGFDREVVVDDIDDAQKRDVEVIIIELHSEHRDATSTKHLQIESDDVRSHHVGAEFVIVEKNLHSAGETIRDAVHRLNTPLGFDVVYRKSVYSLGSG